MSGSKPPTAPHRLIDLVSLSGSELAHFAGAVLVAGIVRGFAGFALSALVTASLVSAIPPVELIPVCWFMELAASLLMTRGSVADADRSAALRLVLGGVLGTPLGLLLTTTVNATVSKLAALGTLGVLAFLQLLRVRWAWLATDRGTLVTGFVGGVVTGIASIGGMVVALFVLARDAPPRQMRATLVHYLLLGSIPSFVYLLAFGVLTEQAAARALVFVPVALLGVVIGRLFFRPALEQFYRRFCLWLLLFLVVVGLLRLA